MINCKARDTASEGVTVPFAGNLLVLQAHCSVLPLWCMSGVALLSPRRLPLGYQARFIGEAPGFSSKQGSPVKDV
jgi:hypothetical protein